MAPSVRQHGASRDKDPATEETSSEKAPLLRKLRAASSITSSLLARQQAPRNHLHSLDSEQSSTSAEDSDGDTTTDRERSERVRRLRAVLGRRRSLSVTGAEDLGRRNLEY